jgi:hypothetical protein
VRGALQEFRRRSLVPADLLALAIRKSSSFDPDWSAATNQGGCLPRPDQVSVGADGLKYLGRTFGYLRLGRSTFEFGGGASPFRRRVAFENRTNKFWDDGLGCACGAGLSWASGLRFRLHEQQICLMLHRTRHLFIRSGPRDQLSPSALLAEFGFVAPVGRSRSCRALLPTRTRGCRRLPVRA